MDVIREYHEIIYIENAFAAFQKARLNIYRLDEIEKYVNEKGYFTEVGWKYWKSKIELRTHEFQQLESSIGIRALKPIDNIRKDTLKDFVGVKEVVRLIKEYLVLNYKIEKTVLSILKSLVSLVKERHKDFSKLIEGVFDGYARHLREIKINNLDIKLNQVSTDDDKIITYEIQAKEKKTYRHLNLLTEEQLIFKIRDNESLILKEYQELDRYEKLLSTTISNNMDVIDKMDKDKNDKFNKNGNIFNWVLALLAFIFVIYSALADTISILQNEGFSLFKFLKLLFYLTLQ